MGLFSFLTVDEGKRLLERAQAIVPTINALEAGLSLLSDDELKAKTGEFKERLKNGETLDDILPEAFALVREVSKRVSGQRHYDVQMIGGLILHWGNISEMRTGEGKTLVGTLPTYLNALTGEGVHVVTVNDFLSRRDAVWMGQIYHFLGLSVGVLNDQMSFVYDATHSEKDKERDLDGSFKVVYEFLKPVTRQEAYGADITYGTSNQFGFDYLRDNLTTDKSQLVQREHAYAIVDEVDSILIDEARTPLIISAPSEESEDLYLTFAKIAKILEEKTDYVVDEKNKQVELTLSGIGKAESALGIENMYTDGGVKYVHHLHTAVQAKALFLKERDYVVRNNEIVIIDAFTGRMQPGRRWSWGIHQAIEAKEGLPIQKEMRTVASITAQNYFRLYKKLSGMTGTAKTSAEEFYKVYGLEVVEIPTHRPVSRIDRNDLIYGTEEIKFRAVAKKVKELHLKGQPVLLGTVSIDKNEALSEALTRAGVPHQVLNAKNHEKEGEITAQAGQKGRVTVATNMAGRGVDIKLGGVHATQEEYEEVKALGGLFVIGTERHDSRRIDNQLRGRAGRQGDPGETQFFVSLEDDLLRIFGGDRIKGLLKGLTEDEPISVGLISKSLENAQNQVEGRNFDARKATLQYDDVLNQQRKAIYESRKISLVGTKEEIEEKVKKLIESFPELASSIQKKREEYGEEIFLQFSRRVMLQSIDVLWAEHLEAMDYLRSQVSLRAVGQRDPLVEYKREASILYRDLEVNIQNQMKELFEKAEMRGLPQKEAKPNKYVASGGGETNDGGTQAPIVKDDKVGRNDPCPCGSGKKYKKCHGAA